MSVVRPEGVVAAEGTLTAELADRRYMSDPSTWDPALAHLGPNIEELNSRHACGGLRSSRQATAREVEA